MPNWDAGEGIFSQLDSAKAVPWAEMVDPLGLDIAYHGQRSGDKFVASMIYRWLDAATAELTEDGIMKLVAALKARYGQKWGHLWQTYMMEYDPLKTYNITESGSSSGSQGGTVNRLRTPNLTTNDTLDMTDTSTHDQSDKLTHGESIATNNSMTHGESISIDRELKHGENITSSGTLARTDTHSVSGFNSTDPVSASTDNRSDATSSTEAHSGTDSSIESEVHSGTDHGTGSEVHSGTDSTVIEESSQLNRDSTHIRTETGTDKNEETRDLTENEEYTRTRSGNMYRSPAELISFDREFWLTDYFSIVFADVDEMLTLAIYSESSVNRTIY